MLRCKPMETSKIPNTKYSSNLDFDYINATKYRRLIGNLYILLSPNPISHIVWVSLVSSWKTKVEDVTRILQYIKEATSKDMREMDA